MFHVLHAHAAYYGVIIIELRHVIPRNVITLAQEIEETSTPTRLVENVVLATKGLQERNTQLLDVSTAKNM